mmetsp:Transcript_19601/g.31167  ORF Transcript_19601/g.31167 Transcript_19601/m.31167 type:complete len:193 (-) Transcript_19601:1149-1727(-)
MLWNVLTYPLILLGLFRGSFLTYQAMKKDEKEQKEQLEYWVVIIALLFLFPWIEYVLSFFLFAGLVGVIKFGTLFMVVASKKKGYGFIYTLIEEHFIGLVEPYIERWIKQSEGVRQQVCSSTVLFLAMAQRSINNTLMPMISDQHLYYLAKAVQKSLKDINKEQALREKSKSDRGATSPSKPGSAVTDESQS